MEPICIQSKAHKRLGDTGDESGEGVQRWFVDGESLTHFHETVMEHFSSMLQLAGVNA